MKIQCNVCEVEEAKVLCCADEAALCLACDEKVHAANKLASKHQRVSLSRSSSQMPKCDICQETAGYFFCLEDRALLCRKCDVSIHTANAYVSAHQRFLLTGVKVALESTAQGPSSVSEKSQSHVSDKTTAVEPPRPSTKRTVATMAGHYNSMLPVQGDGGGNFASSRLPPAGGSSMGNMQQWQFDEFLVHDFSQNYGYMDNGSSKADSGRFGDSDCSPILRSIEEERDADECLGQVPDASWAVPQMPSPPTASGLYWPKTNQHFSDMAAFVPDICSPLQSFHNCQQSGASVLKRRRQF